MNKAALGILVCFSVDICTLVLLDIDLGVELRCHSIGICLCITLIDIAKQFSKVVESVCTPPAIDESFGFSTCLSTLQLGPEERGGVPLRMEVDEKECWRYREGAE